MNIEIVDHITPEMEEQKWKWWGNYENSHGINSNYKCFYMIMSETDGTIVGILNAYILYDEIHVAELLINANFQRKGFGYKLLLELEQQFEDKGFSYISLSTFEFQAPEFYKKCGFELEFIRKNPKDPKLTKYYFVKYFKNETQN